MSNVNGIIKSGAKSTCEDPVISNYGQVGNYGNIKKFETSSLIGTMSNTNFNTNNINRQLPTSNIYDNTRVSIY